MDVAAWLSSLGLGKYATTFAKNEITSDVLPHLSDADLKALGLPMGPRKLLLAAIAKLHPPDLPVHTTAAKFELTPRLGSPLRSEAERRQLTVMFVDLAGSTALSVRLDPEEMGAVLRAYQNTVAAEVTRVNGHVAKFMGDGVLVYFGWPRAQEDAAERAVRAGLAIVASVAELTTPAKVPLGARVGIATGLVVVGDLIGEGTAQEAAVVGETPNLAARLQSIAEIGSVVVAEATRRLLGEFFELNDVGLHHLKGFSRPVRAWQVVREGGAESRFEALRGMRRTLLVGRESELALLLDRWQRAKIGRGQVVLLSGEPGIGKSRLMITLRESLRREKWLSLRYDGSPYRTNSALFPVLDHLRRAAYFEHEDAPEVKLAKLERLFASTLPDPQAVVALLAEEMSIPAGDRWRPPALSPQEKKAKTFEALLAQLKGITTQQPVLIEAEDAHWFDPTSLELFERVIDLVERLPMMMVVTFRSEFTPTWTDRPHVTQRTLDRLGQDESAMLIDELTGGRALPEEVKSHILARTEGVPLFVEELTKAVLESGQLREAGAHFELVGSLPSLAIPSTLQDSLLARLDRLAPVKEVAQIGAVIGREFSYELLAATAQIDEPKLTTALAQLVDAELAFCSGRLPNVFYTFKHALVRDAAYASLLKSRRQQLHARIATLLRDRFPDRAEAEPEVLAHHATEGGLLDEAVAYWYRAGLRANYRSAHAEAIAHFSKGLEILPLLPKSSIRNDREIDLHLALGIPVAAKMGRVSAEAMATYARAKELCDRFGSAPAQLCPALRGLWATYRSRGQIPKAQELADQLLTIAESADDPSILLEAHHAQWTTHYSLGNWQSVCKHTAQGLALYRTEYFAQAFIYSGHDSAVCATAHEGVSLWMLGFPDRALARANESILSARQLSHPPSLMHALFYASVLHHFRRDAASARDVIKARLELARDRVPGDLDSVIQQMALISGLDDQQQAGANMATIQAALPLELSRDVEWRAYILCLFAGVCDMARQPDVGLSVLKSAVAEMNDNGVRLWEPELHRLVGNLLQRSDKPDFGGSQACYLHAIEMAREQHARSLELRTATSLARLWADRGKQQKACDLLAPIYAWFTEGFSTADLIEAKRLLDEIA